MLRGKTSQPQVLRNMQLLIDERLPFGCITVLSRMTVRNIRYIYKFFEEIDTSFRILPIYRTGYSHQQDGLALTDVQIVNAFKEVVDLWLRSDSSIQVRPIQDYLTNVLAKLGGVEPRNYYDKMADEVVYIVEPDGALYSVADPPDVRLCHGNIFRSPLRDLKRSAGYLRAVAAANERLEQACSDCAYYGVCSCYFMGEATPEQRTTRENGLVRCGVAQPLHEYIERVLTEIGGFDLARAEPATQSHSVNLTAHKAGRPHH